MASKVKKTPLTTEQFELIGSVPDWQCHDIPVEDWSKIPGLQRLHDTIAVMGSASITNPKILNNIEAVAGMDVLAHESHPRVKKGETDGNAYHYVVQRIDHPAYPYILHGPFRCETLVRHWFEDDDLSVYWDDRRT